MVELLLQRVEEAPERHEALLGASLDGLRGLLVGGEHAALAGRKALALVAVLADLLQDVGHKRELVAYEREALDELALVGVAAQVAAGVLEAEQVLEDRRLLVELALEGDLGGVGLVEHALLDDLVDAAGGEGEARLEATLDLGEVVADDHHHLIDGLLAGDDHPDAALALGADLLDEGLQVQHEVHVVVEVLAHLVDHEQEAEATVGLRGATLAVLVDVAHELAEVDRYGVSALRPFRHRVDGEAARAIGRLGKLLGEHLVALAILDPGGSGYVLVGGAELIGLAAIVDHLLEAGELVVAPVEAKVVIEDAGERAQHGGARGVALLEAAALLVDVEQDGLCVNARGALDLGERHGVVELVLEVLDRGLAVDVAILEQVAKHLQEVGLTGPKVALDPDARVPLGVVEAALVGLEEVVEVTLQLARDDVLLELLPDGIVLADVHDSVDVAVDILREHFLDLHGCAFLDEIERTVIVAICKLAEEREGTTVIGAGVGNHDGHVTERGLHVVEHVVNAHERVHLAHAGNEDDVAGLVRPPVHGGDVRLRRRNALELLEQAVPTPLLLLRGKSVKDAPALADLEQHVVEVALMDARPHVIRAELARVCVCDKPLEVATGLELERGVIAEGEDPRLVAKPLVGQEVRIAQTLAQVRAARLEVLRLHRCGHLHRPLYVEGRESLGVALVLDCATHVEVEEYGLEPVATCAPEHAALDKPLAKHLLDLGNGGFRHLGDVVVLGLEPRDVGVHLHLAEGEVVFPIAAPDLVDHEVANDWVGAHHGIEVRLGGSLGKARGNDGYDALALHGVHALHAHARDVSHHTLGRVLDEVLTGDLLNHRLVVEAVHPELAHDAHLAHQELLSRYLCALDARHPLTHPRLANQPRDTIGAQTRRPDQRLPSSAGTRRPQHGRGVVPPALLSGLRGILRHRTNATHPSSIA